MPYSSGGYTPIKPGQPLTAKEINRNIAQGPMRGAQYTGNADTRRFHNGNAVDLPGDTGISPWSAYFKYAEVQSVGEDSLTCKNYSNVAGADSGGSFTVAKPYLLQQYPFNGQTITYIDGDQITYTKDATDPEYKRNHDDGSSDADFVITPNYYVGEVILIMRVPTLVGGSTVADWMECGMGRYWARV
jgi:hypothetical protein